MNKSNKLFLILLLILCVFVTPTLVFSGPFMVANGSVDSLNDGMITDDATSDDSNSVMQSSSGSKGSKTHIQAKKYPTINL